MRKRKNKGKNKLKSFQIWQERVARDVDPGFIDSYTRSSNLSILANLFAESFMEIAEHHKALVEVTDRLSEHLSNSSVEGISDTTKKNLDLMKDVLEEYSARNKACAEMWKGEEENTSAVLQGVVEKELKDREKVMLNFTRLKNITQKNDERYSLKFESGKESFEKLNTPLIGKLDAISQDGELFLNKYFDTFIGTQRELLQMERVISYEKNKTEMKKKAEAPKVALKKIENVVGMDLNEKKEKVKVDVDETFGSQEKAKEEGRFKLSMSELSFNTKLDIVPLGKPTVATFNIKNLSHEKLRYNITYPKGKNYDLSFSPVKGVIKQGKTQRVKATIMIEGPPNIFFTCAISDERDNRFFTLRARCENGYFGTHLESQEFVEDHGFQIPKVLSNLRTLFDEMDGYSAEGIFRRSGDSRQVLKVKQGLNNDIIEKVVDVHIVSSLIKIWFREMPVHIMDTLPTANFPDIKNSETAAEIANKLPEKSREVFYWLVDLLERVQRQKGKNKMDVRNLCIVVAPNLYNPESSNPIEIIVNTQRAVSFLYHSVEGKAKQFRGETVEKTDQVKQEEPAEQSTEKPTEQPTEQPVEQPAEHPKAEYPSHSRIKNLSAEKKKRSAIQFTPSGLDRVRDKVNEHVRGSFSQAVEQDGDEWDEDFSEPATPAAPVENPGQEIVEEQQEPSTENVEDMQAEEQYHAEPAGNGEYQEEPDNEGDWQGQVEYAPEGQEEPYYEGQEDTYQYAGQEEQQQEEGNYEYNEGYYEGVEQENYERGDQYAEQGWEEGYDDVGDDGIENPEAA